MILRILCFLSSPVKRTLGRARRALLRSHQKGTEGLLKNLGRRSASVDTSF